MSVDEAPTECLSLMTESWHEDPGKRPSFDDIFKQVRGRGRGSEVNLTPFLLGRVDGSDQCPQASGSVVCVDPSDWSD